MAASDECCAVHPATLIEVFALLKTTGQVAKPPVGYEGLHGLPLAGCRHLNDHPCIVALTGIYPIGGVFRVVVAIPPRRSPCTDWCRTPWAARGSRHSTWLRSTNWPWPVRCLCLAPSKWRPCVQPPIASPRPHAAWSVADRLANQVGKARGMLNGRAVGANSDQGPVLPKAGMETMTICGLVSIKWA